MHSALSFAEPQGRASATQKPRRMAPAGLLASRSWRGVVAAARTPLQAALAPCGASFAILSPFRGEDQASLLRLALADMRGVA